MTNKHLISIVGAGPGDPELLTMKAHQRLANAEAVLYDALHGTEVLEIAPKTAERIYVGKIQCDGQDQMERQNAIHQKMFELAKLGKRVVRLKTGDPMVFGRGAEEIRFCKENRLNYEVIPGITTEVAGSALLEVPITERNKSPMVLLYTGHRTNGSISNIESVVEVLKGGGTVSMYMGLKSIGLLAKTVIEKGIDGKIPVHILSQVSQKGQAIFTSSLFHIQEDMETTSLKTPAIFMIGRYAQRI
ncbi:MAG: uroporphyrinogen-III C-methyltransferase [Prolixibacteraceae bacterium]